MNWRMIAKYTVALFLLRFALGTLEGYFSMELEFSTIWGWLASFSATAWVFAHLSLHQPGRLRAHSIVVLLLEQVLWLIAQIILIRAIPVLDQDYPLPLLIVGYVVLVAAVVVGLSIGAGIRRRRAGKALSRASL